MAIANTAEIGDLNNPQDDNVTLASSANSIDTQDIDVLRVLLLNENPEHVVDTKNALKQLHCAVQAHRVTGLEDLSEALANTDWDVIIGYANSNLFLPTVIQSHIEQSSVPVKAIYLDSNYSGSTAVHVMQLGFNDYLIQQEENRLVFSILREARAIRNFRKAQTADSSLAKIQANNQLLLDSTSDAIAYIADGMIVHANKTFVEALGHSSADDIAWQPFIDLVDSEYQSDMRSILKNLTLGQEQTQEVEIGVLNAEQKAVKKLLSFASTSFNGEPCTQVMFVEQKSVSALPANTQAAAESTLLMPEVDTSSDISADSNAQAASLQAAMRHIEQLNGKGALFFAAFDNIAGLRQALGFDAYAIWLDHVTATISESIANISLLDRVGESWIFAVDNEDDLNQIASILCETLNKSLTDDISDEKCEFSLGVSKYGVAELTPVKAMHNAFTACAATQLEGGGYKIISPRLDNAEASEALGTALELGRLRVKYQPIVGLQNQGAQLYEVCPFIENDAGREQSAQGMIASLGIEKKNMLLDQWLINSALKDLAEQSQDTHQLCITLPLTTSALVDETFTHWLIEAFKAYDIPANKLCFSFSPAQLNDFDKKGKALFDDLGQLGFYTVISDCKAENSQLINRYKPKFIQFSSELTKQLSNPEAPDDRATLKAMLNDARDIAASCISSGVDSAAELALLWQLGVPYVQGHYLQGPMANMSYDFSEIG